MQKRELNDDGSPVFGGNFFSSPDARKQQYINSCPKKETAVKKHMFCETATAGPMTPWHIRPITEVGPKYGGGSDTLALCGAKVAWDLQVEITQHHLGHACEKCVEVYRELSARGD